MAASTNYQRRKQDETKIQVCGKTGNYGDQD